MSTPWILERGATLLDDGSVRFTVWAPHATSVDVELLGDDTRERHPMARDEHAVFSAVVPAVGAGVDYFYVIDGSRCVPDPVSRSQPAGVHGPSRVMDPHFAWHDAEWTGVPLADYVIYELHIGTFTAEGTFEAAIPHLAALAALGVTAIAIMPVAQFPGTRNWGYDGTALYAPQESYGGPAGLHALVDEAHTHGLAVILDVVYNHVGPEGNYLAAYGPYFTNAHHTPWGEALNYDDAYSDDVRRLVVDNALYWVTEFHVDALRLDAVHRIYDCSAQNILAEIAAAVHTQGAQLGRQLLVIAESDLNDPRVVRDAASHGHGLDAQWSDDFHHAVHALLTGERTGYYADFGGVESVAHALEEPFLYHGQHSAFRKRRHGAPSTGLPRERFVVSVQTHDQVGNRAAGERLASLVDEPRLRLAAALLLLSPYVPMLFMGQEYAETRPFLYFTSHTDATLSDAVRSGRRQEFEPFGWGDAVPDPQAEETFERSKLDRSVVADGMHARALELYRDLLALRRDEPMLRPDGSTASVEWSANGGITLLRYARAWRMGRTGALLALFNCSAAPLDVAVPEDATGAWTLRFSTEAPAYGGDGAMTQEIPDNDAARTSRKDGPKRLLESQQEHRSVLMPAWSAAVWERRDF